MLGLLSFAPTNPLSCLDNYNRKLSLSLSSSILSCFEKMHSYRDPRLSQSHFDPNEPEYGASAQLLFAHFPLYRPIISGKIRDLRKFSRNYRHISGLQSSASLCQATWSQRQRPLPQHYRTWIRSTVTSPTLSHEFLLNISIMKSCVGQSQNKKQKANKRILLERDYFPWHWFCWLCTSRADPRTCVSTPLTGWIHRNSQGSVAARVERDTGERPRIRLEFQAAPTPTPADQFWGCFLNSPSSSSFL